MEEHDERRSDRRSRTLKGGHVVYDGGFGAAECTVCNVSQSGAMVEFPGVVALPSEITLYIDSERQSWPCRVTWRDGRRIGVAFTGPPVVKPRPPPPPKRRDEGY